MSDAVSAFRKEFISLLAENGIEGSDELVIMRVRSGCQIHPSLTLDDQSHQPQQVTKFEPGETPADRQNWILGELKTGRKLRRSDPETHFKISMATAMRDFRMLNDPIEFTGPGGTGCYVLRS